MMSLHQVNKPAEQSVFICK